MDDLEVGSSRGDTHRHYDLNGAFGTLCRLPSVKAQPARLRRLKDLKFADDLLFQGQFDPVTRDRQTNAMTTLAARSSTHSSAHTGNYGSRLQRR